MAFDSKDWTATEDAVAKQTAQHVWSDDDGLHVSATGDHDVSGINSLFTALKMAFRKAAVELMSLTADGMDVNTADGTTATSVAHFGAATRIGTTDGRHVSIDSDGLTLGNGTRSGLRMYSDVSASDASIASENHIAASGLLDIGVGFGSYSPDTGMKLYSGGSTRYAAINSGDVDKLGWRGNDDGDLVIVDGTTYPLAKLATAISPTTLFSGDSAGTVTLSESLASYSRIEIDFMNNDGMCSSLTVDSPNGKTVVLSVGTIYDYNGAPCVSLKNTKCLCSGTTITPQLGMQVNFDGASNARQYGWYIYVTKVIGWK